MKCNLITITDGVDNYGFDTDGQESKIKVDCERKEVSHTEFYQALAHNIKPKLILTIRIEDWNLSRIGNKYAEFIEFDSIRYKVVRTFQKTSRIEITCE